MKLIALLMLSLSLPVFAEAPKCVNQGTRSEGWRYPNGELHFDQCSEKVAFCGAKGSKSEGWYIAEVVSNELIGFANCDKDPSTEPKIADTSKLVLCNAVGTRSEGWYAVAIKSETRKRLYFNQCAK